MVETIWGYVNDHKMGGELSNMFIFLFCVQMSLLMIIQSNHELKKEMEGQFELYYCSLLIGKCSILFG